MKIAVNEVVVVEGKYDKIKLESLIDADIITLDGFGIFKSDEKKALIRHAASTRGVIVLTDSDSAGMVIRNHIKSVTGGKGVTNLYIPSVEGKEKRKAEPSKEGLLGVEGISPEVIRELFRTFAVSEKRPPEISRQDLYERGFMGLDGSKERREALQKRLSLPKNMSSTALLSALNILLTKEEFIKICEEIK